MSMLSQWYRSRLAERLYSDPRTAPRQIAPNAFDRPVFCVDATDGWLALIRDGKPVGIAKARPFMPAWTNGYWRPIDAATAALYRCTLEEIES